MRIRQRSNQSHCGPPQDAPPRVDSQRNMQASTLGQLGERLVCPSSAAERIGVSPKTLANWRWRRVGPAFIKLGDPRGRGAVRYEIPAIEAWLAAHRRNGEG